MVEGGVTLMTAGSRVRRLIEARREATVIATFQRSLYLRDDEGRIVCLGGQGLGAGPLNGLCSAWEEKAPAPGTRATWHGPVLDLGMQTIDTATVADWQAPLPAVPTGAPLASGLKRLATMPARGLGRIIPTLVENTIVEPADRFEAAAFKSLIVLTEWLRQPAGEPPASLERLIGLGPGLTPAGDDALGGAMIASRLLARRDIADRLAHWLLPRAREATSDISFAHLEAAADGEGAAALHDTLPAIAADDASLPDCIARLDRIGHSSGWDALAGAVAALLAHS